MLENAMKRLYESRRGTSNTPAAREDAKKLLKEAFAKGDFKIGDFSIRRSAEECLGREWFSGEMRLNESVTSSTFLDLANVILTGVVIKEFEEADINRGDAMAETRSVQYIDQGRDIGLTRVDANVRDEVKEGEDFPRFGMGENWKTYPSTKKRGGIVEVTKEAIKEDRTGQIITNAQGVSDEVVAEKNERILKVVLGIDNAVYYPQGVATATYTSTDTNRVNLLGSNELVDWTDVDAVWQLWQGMKHPVTGRPILMNPSNMSVLVMPFKMATAAYVFGATQLWVGTETSAPQGKSVGPNPIAFLGKQFQSPQASQMAYYMLTLAAAQGGGAFSTSDAQKMWYVGDFKSAFVYLQNYGINVITQGADSEAAFRRDVVFATRASERGIMGVKEPRYVAQIRGAALA